MKVNDVRRIPKSAAEALQQLEAMAMLLMAGRTEMAAHCFEATRTYLQDEVNKEGQTDATHNHGN